MKLKCLFLIFLLLTINCSQGAEKLLKHINKVEFGDLERVIKNRYLRILTTKNPYDYYIAKGEIKGIQYEMAREFVKYLNKKYIKNGKLKIAFEMIPVDFDQLIPMLNAGKGDIIAVGLTHTLNRKSLVNFSVPYRIVDDVIVTRKELAHNPWKGKIFHVQKNSSYFYALKGQNKLVDIKEVDPNFNAENIMEFISLKKYDYTLVDSFWAESISKRFKNLEILRDRAFRKNVEIGWAVNKKSPHLLNELNYFLPKVRKGTLLGNTFGHKYFYDIGRIQSEDFDMELSRISKYDDSLKKYAKKYNFDWRLLAALCLQESRFNQEIENKWGAIGLFQIKKMTAEEPYIAIKPIDGKENFDNNIHAGVKYLFWLKKKYFDSQVGITEEDRLRMMLASYNAGPKRVKDAVEKTKQMGLNPKIWFRNIELGMLELGYNEPVIYVSEINKHYVSYLLLGIK